MLPFRIRYSNPMYGEHRKTISVWSMWQVHGNHMGPTGLGLLGSPWVSLGLPGSPWVSLGPGSPWVSLGLPPPWVSLGLPGAPYICHISTTERFIYQILVNYLTLDLKKTSFHNTFDTFSFVNHPFT